MMPARVNGPEGSLRPTPRVMTEDGMLIRVRAFAVHIFTAAGAALALAALLYAARREWPAMFLRPCGSELASGITIDGPGQEGAIAGRPAYDHWMNSPSSGRIQPTIRLG